MGLIEILSTDIKIVPEEFENFTSVYKTEEFKSMVQNVNDARQVIMQRVIDMNENLSEKDLPEIQRVFGKLNAENALAGEMIQNRDGKWLKK